MDNITKIDINTAPYIIRIILMFTGIITYGPLMARGLLKYYKIAMIIPIVLAVSTIVVELSLRDLGSKANISSDTRANFFSFSEKCLYPLGPFIKPIDFLKEPNSFSSAWTYEYIILTILILDMGIKAYIGFKELAVEHEGGER